MSEPKKQAHAAEHAPATPDPQVENQEPVPPSAPPSGGAALVEPPEEAVLRLEAERDELKEKYLRLAAEYDNFRKRTVRERADLWGKAQADLVQRLVDALDDLSRFAHVDPAQTDVTAIHDGIDMVERKLLKELEGIGVTRVDQVGVPFDPTLHEAVTTLPASDPTQHHTVGAILQAGYRLGGTLIRPARVQVLTWEGEGS